MNTGTVIAYFVSHDEAREALRKIRKKGFRRAAWVSKGADGGIRVRDPFPWRRILGTGMAFILFACLGAAISLGLQWWGPLPVSFPSALVPTVASGFIGILLSLAWIRRSRFGIERSLVLEQTRLLLSGESVLILKGPTESLRILVTLLLESSEIPPAVFVLHPRREVPVEGSWSPGALLTPAQLEEQARRLALEDRVDPKPPQDTELLQRLERSRRWIQLAYLDLSEACRLEQSMPPTAEWLLDNEYILESNASDVRLNLPRHYYRQLPALASGPNQGLPRIYGLAQELAAHSDLRLDEENILAFIEAYQSVGPLSIGELWAVPQMLRAVLIEGIRHLADRALTELHEGEIADLWASRLISANLHDPNQLYSVLADLTETHPSPSPYFASQLIDYLYDETAALAPVQSWLERVLRRSPGDLSLREKNRQTKDQISIGNAFTSLRQLALLDWKECFERLSRVEGLLRQDPAGIYPRMDFATRDQYRRAVEDLHRGCGLPEDQVAQRALDLAAEPGPGSPVDERSSHVGTYLIGE